MADSVNNDLCLGIGNVSHESELGKYYQDFAPAIYHFENNSFGDFDEDGIPYLHGPEGDYYGIVYIIQYALINYDLMLDDDDAENRKTIIGNCVDWLDRNREDFKDSSVWRSPPNSHYNLDDGWISGMYQGQAISLFLRAYQLFGEDKYLTVAEKCFEFLKYDYSEGGVKRVDADGNIWFEEYPTEPPSLVLNGFVYTIFGIYDLYRVTGKDNVKDLFDACVRTLESNLYKYDVWYWSVYDQLREELVSYYYQKNVHIPLMGIMHQLTGKDVFERYYRKWEKNLQNPFHRLLVTIMYRVQPRIKKWKSKKL